MAHVKRRVRVRRGGDGTVARTTVYQAVWREHANAADRTKTFRRKADANRFLLDVQHRLLTGAYADPTLGQTPFRVAAERYLGLGVWRPRTRQSATEKLRYAIEHFGDRPIATIRKGDVQSFLSALARDLAPNTIRIIRQHLAASFDAAIDDRLIAVNPCRGVRVPKAERSPVIPLTSDQARAMIDGAQPWFRAAIVIGTGLGLRQSEAAGLTLDRVDFLRRTIRVDRQWQQASGTRWPWLANWLLPRYGSSTDASASLTWSSSGSSSLLPAISTIQARVLTLPTPTTLRAACT
jgi:hypothetical protein